MKTELSDSSLKRARFKTQIWSCQALRDRAHGKPRLEVEQEAQLPLRLRLTGLGHRGARGVFFKGPIWFPQARRNHAYGKPALRRAFMAYRRRLRTDRWGMRSVPKLAVFKARIQAVQARQARWARRHG